VIVDCDAYGCLSTVLNSALSQSFILTTESSFIEPDCFEGSENEEKSNIVATPMRVVLRL
jgi:hypothetical protein